MKKVAIFFQVLSILVFIVGIVCLVLVMKEKINEYKSAYKLGRNIVYRASDVLGISTDKANVSIDYAKQIATGSPLVFGGAHNPNVEHQDAWNKIAYVGVTNIRKDFFIEDLIPANISLQDYKNNKNNIQDVRNWNQTKINEKISLFKNAKERNLKVIAIVSYAPKWLTYSGKIYGVPSDWDIYEDLVKKTYLLFRDYVDYLEIWNEPNYPAFMDVQKSGLSREEAYYLIFKHAVNAIRSVDNQIKDNKQVILAASSINLMK